MRKGMWEKVAKRSHYPKKIFAFGPGSDEVMLFGTVDYELKDGKKTTLQWSARAQLADEGWRAQDVLLSGVPSRSVQSLLKRLLIVRAGYCSNVSGQVDHTLIFFPTSSPMTPYGAFLACHASCRLDVHLCDAPVIVNDHSHCLLALEDKERLHMLSTRPRGSPSAGFSPPIDNFLAQTMRILLHH